MKKIHIFVAGAKDLKQQRTALKALGNDINAEYEHSGVDANLSIRTYENFGENQEEYNKFIQEKADLIIFVLEGKIGPYTEKEFLLAYQQLQQKNHPKIMVFLKEFEAQTADIQYIEGLLKGSIDQFYVNYKNNEDLVAKAKDRIKRFVKEQNEKKSIKGFLKRFLKPMCFAAAILLMIAGGILANKVIKPSQILLIAGGGSAANYLERNKPNFDLDAYPDGYYVHMPSGNAMLLLTEEVITTLKPEERRYYPICLSASEANDSSFTKIITKNAFVKKGSVIAVCLGKDSLSVCIKKDEVFSSMVKDMDGGTITVEELINIIKSRAEKHVNVFTTSAGSGTRNTYEKLLATKGFNFKNEETLLFAENSDLEQVVPDETPYILLGSNCYYMKQLYDSDVKSGKAKFLTVIDEGKAIEKPIYLYFMAYVVEPNSPALMVPQPTIDLLRKLDVPLDDKIKNNRLLRRYTDRVVIPFESLQNI